MKKLMIAAAVMAAMAGGAYAADLAYDFTANLKTTTGKTGSTKVSYTYNLGWDGVGTFWYEDAAVTAQMLAKPEYFTTKVVGGNRVPALTAEAKKDYTWLYYTLNVPALAATYDVKSSGKWCESLKVTITPGGCYRVATSVTKKAVVKTTDCCTELYLGDDITIGFDLNNRFGALAKEKATKVEVCGYVNNYCDGTTVDNFSLAGQGVWKDNLVKVNGVTYAGVSSINGSIVGVLDAPTCEYCCELPDNAFAYECELDYSDDTLPTAAYGTWTLKFNKKNSAF